MLERSCGTIPYTVQGGQILYLLVQTKDDGVCGFPKGHMEGNETEVETAFRETWEEASVKPEIDPAFRYEITYHMRNGNDKLVVYFPGNIGSQTPAHNPGFESFRYRLLPFEEAYQALTFDNAKEMLKAANDYLAK